MAFPAAFFALFIATLPSVPFLFSRLPNLLLFDKNNKNAKKNRPIFQKKVDKHENILYAYKLL